MPLVYSGSFTISERFPTLQPGLCYKQALCCTLGRYLTLHSIEKVLLLGHYFRLSVIVFL